MAFVALALGHCTLKAARCVALSLFLTARGTYHILHLHVLLAQAFKRFFYVVYSRSCFCVSCVDNARAISQHGMFNHLVLHASLHVTCRQPQTSCMPAWQCGFCQVETGCCDLMSVWKGVGFQAKCGRRHKLLFCLPRTASTVCCLWNTQALLLSCL